jgi:hypothetical protein
VKLIRFGEAGRERPGLQLEDGTRIDASRFGGDYDESFFAGDGLQRLPRRASVPEPGSVRRSAGRARSSASA